MSHLVLYVLGPPGVGKTTLVRSLLSPLCKLHPSPKWTVGFGVAAAGHYRGDTFDGGDTVPYSGARAALDYWRDRVLPEIKLARVQYALTILDGDRFSTQPSLDFIRATGERVLGLHLVADEQYLVARRAARGSNQNEAWMRGRVTKAANFAKKVPHLVIDANQGADHVLRVSQAVIAHVAQSKEAA